MDANAEPTLTVDQAYEAAYRFVGQYYQREPLSESLALMAVAMEPSDDLAKTDDPASWADWQTCVAETLSGAPVPRLPRTDT